MDNSLNIELVNFEKQNGLIPAVIQHAQTLEVLMLGFMNKTAIEQTLATQHVTFFSRSRQVLWIKGETSGNYLNVQDIKLDCDKDALLIYVLPDGPTCHTGAVSCFNGNTPPPAVWLLKLKEIVAQRKKYPQKNSYTTDLLQGKLNRLAQKIGEEGVEVALAAMIEDKPELIGEIVDLLYHLFVLIEAKDISLAEIGEVIKARSR